MAFPTTTTRDGTKVRIYTLAGGGQRPIHGAWYDPELDEWVPCSWLPGGKFDGKGPRILDLKWPIKTEV